MLGLVQGTVLKCDTISGVLFVEVLSDSNHGVAYEVFVPNYLLDYSDIEGRWVSLWIFSFVTDTAILFYGFSSYEEKVYFGELLKVKGVGPKVALGVLSACGGDVKALTYNDVLAVRGVGKVVAQRIINKINSLLVV